LPAILDRHHHVENDQKGRLGGPQMVKGFLSAGDGDHRVALDFQQNLHRLPLVVGFVREEEVACGLLGRRQAPSAWTGRVTVNVAPWPSPSLAAWTVPPCCLTKSRTIVRPSPSPRCKPVTTRVPRWRKRSKTWGSKSARIPCQVSERSEEHTSEL